MKNKKKGTTLIEIILSIAILAIVIPAIMSLIITSVKTNVKTKDKQEAFSIAQKTIESFKFDKVPVIPAEGPLTIEKQEGEYKVIQTIDVLEGAYSFPSTTETSITKAIEITVHPKAGSNLIDVKDYTTGITAQDLELNNITIIKDSTKILTQIGATTPIESITTVDKKDIIVNLLASEKVDNMTIKIKNNTNEILNLYLLKENNQKINCTIEKLSADKITTSGSINIINSVYLGNAYSNTSRVYKIKVQIYDGNGNKLEEVTALKNVGQ